MDKSKNRSDFFLVGSALVLISVLIYLLHHLIFREPYQTAYYTVMDLAFLPINVFLVVLVIERILSQREKEAILQKLNMVVGAFFSEVGNELLGKVLASARNRNELSANLNLKSGWGNQEFKKAATYARTAKYEVDMETVDLSALKTFLVKKRAFLLRLLENQNLIEHQRFTDLLWAVFHLDEELEARTDFSALPAADSQHLAGDIHRMYGHLTAQWVDYILHLKNNYPYLFSLVLRIHPFQDNPSPVLS